jgi:threonyl-tRNA synthetase
MSFAHNVRGVMLAVSPNPSFVTERVAIFDRLWAKQQAEAQQAQANGGSPINITLPNGTVVPGVALVTTPMDVAKGISNGLADAVIVAKVC